MGTLEKVTQMRDQGLSDEDIIYKLQEEKVSPKEINNALNQAQIKSAVGGEEEIPAPTPTQASNAPRGYAPRTKEVEEDVYSPKPVEESYAPGPEIPEIQESEYDTGQESGAQEFYPQEGYGGYGDMGMTSTDTMIETAEQVFSEKVKKIQKSINDLNEFKTLTQMRIEDMAERLKRIESSFDNLQLAILDKVGAYGQSLATTKKEVAMMQDSFRKIVNPIVNKSSIQRKPISTRTKTVTKKTVKKK